MFGNRVLSALMIVSCAHAAPLAPSSDDDMQDIAITSRAFDYNHKTGVAIYTGQVYAKQGSRQLWGDTLQIFRAPSGDIDKIIVVGKPAKMQQQGDIYEAPLIEYDPEKETVRSPQNENGQTTITLKPRAKS
jgi:lipopolysaccharide export system protein LptA